MMAAFAVVILLASSGGYMRYLLLCLLASLVACSSAQHADTSLDELHHSIRAGTAIEVGEEVRITTVDGSQLQFIVVELPPDAIVGKDVSLPVDEVASLVTLSSTTERTVAASVISTATAWVLFDLLVAAIVVFP